MTTAASVSTTPGRPSARAVTRESAAGRPTPSTHSASRCDEKVESTAENGRARCRRRSRRSPSRAAARASRRPCSCSPGWRSTRRSTRPSPRCPGSAAARAPLDSRTSCGSSGGGCCLWRAVERRRRRLGRCDEHAAAAAPAAPRRPGALEREVVDHRAHRRAVARRRPCLEVLRRRRPVLQLLRVAPVATERRLERGRGALGGFGRHAATSWCSATARKGGDVTQFCTV